MHVALTLTLIFLTTVLAGREPKRDATTVSSSKLPSNKHAVPQSTEQRFATYTDAKLEREVREDIGVLETEIARRNRIKGEQTEPHVQQPAIDIFEVARQEKFYEDEKAAKELYQHETDEWVAYTLQQAEGRRARNKKRQFDNTSVDTDLNLLRAETARRDKIKRDQASFGEPIAPAHQHKGSKLARDWIVRALYERQSDEELDSIANGIRKQLDGLQKRPNSERKEALKRELNEISEELSQRLQDRIDAASKTSTRDHDMAKENAHDYQRPHQHRQPYQTPYQSPYQLTSPHSGGARTAQPAYFGSSSGLLRDDAYYHQNPP